LAWGLQIIDVSNPADPILVGGCDLDDKPIDVFISGQLAYILEATAFNDSRLTIIDVSDPSNPLNVGSYDDTIIDIFVFDTLAYLACESSGFLILDVSDPSLPSIVGSYDRPNVDFKAVFVSDSYGYFAVGDTGLYILDISNPANPTFLGSLDTPHDAKSVFVSNDYAYVAAVSDNWDFANLQVIDVSEPSDPIFAAGYEVPGRANDVYIEDYYIYVADGSSFRILRFYPQTGIIEEINGPERFSLSQNYPNPFNASTAIRYNLTEPAKVTIGIYDILGRRVRTLVREKQQAGRHSIVWNADGFSSGMYFYRIQAGDYTKTKKMLLLK
jgi:hypothetical protein